MFIANYIKATHSVQIPKIYSWESPFNPIVTIICLVVPTTWMRLQNEWHQLICLHCLKYKKRLLLSCIHHFKSDLINNMDHMRISGNEPSSVIPRQTKRFQKIENVDRKVSKQAEAKRDDVIHPQNYNCNQFLYGKFWCSQNATNQPKPTVKPGYMCPRETFMFQKPIVCPKNKKLRFFFIF